MANNILNDIIDSFYKGEVDYKFIIENQKSIEESKDELVLEFNNLVNDENDPTKTLYDLILLTVIKAQEIFPTLVDLFNLTEKRLYSLLGDAVAEVLPIALFNTFNGDYNLIEETLSNKKRTYRDRGSLFEAYSNLCIDNKKSSKLVNFIKSNLANELYENFYDDITITYLDHKLDSLTIVVKELWLKGKIDPNYCGKFYEILDEYLLDKDRCKVDNSIESLFRHLSNFLKVNNLGKMNYGNISYFESLDEFNEKLENFLADNKYDGNLDNYLTKLNSEINFLDIYPLEEIKNEITTVKKDIDIDYELYQYIVIEDCYINSEMENESIEGFLKDYYDLVIDSFEEYLKSNNFTYDDYDNSRSIHFISSELYTEE